MSTKKGKLTEREQRLETIVRQPRDSDSLQLKLCGAGVDLSISVNCATGYAVTANSLRKLADLVDAVYKLENSDIEDGTVPQ